MIQRIQSIYLLLAAILMAVTAFSPLISYVGKVSSKGMLYCCGLINDTNIEIHTWGILFFVAIGAILPLVNIFLFKKRKLQVKIAYAGILSIILFYITAFVYHSSLAAKIESVNIPQYGILLPILVIVFSILAILKIKKDEKLVRSLDRIR